VDYAVKRWGRSLYLLLPKHIAELYGIRVGDRFLVEVREEGGEVLVVYRFPRKQKREGG
jgi:bifunctional DNA-binding transcriptional regulator/antitoxin component of YhaV-PrlF toxin-antitoxin module